MDTEIRYDIGLVCMANRNMGNNMTNYAIYQYLSNMGYSVLLVSNPLNSSLHFPNKTDNRFFQFIQSPYPENDVLAPRESKWELSDINLICGQFVLGSDQLWRDLFVEETDYFTCLDWVASGKSKTAYATSFGVSSFEGNENMREKVGYLLRRFQNISVREQDGVELLKTLYGIEAEHVLDPVFLCEKEYYEKMTERGLLRLPEKKFIGAYLLDITKQKEEILFWMASHFTNGVYEAISPDSSDKIHSLSNPAIEEWLAMIQNSDFFITDSFHGLCFALIFQKQFCVIFDKENWRGFSRIHSLLDLLQLNSRLVEERDDQKILDLYNSQIDYDCVNKILLLECSKNKVWLQNALEKGKAYKGQYDAHDFLWELCSQLFHKQQKLEEIYSKQQVAICKTRNELFMSMRSQREGDGEEPDARSERLQIVGWGAGECFKRNIKSIKSFYDMKFVCDNDPQKWGKEIAGQILCISPETLSTMENIVVIIMVDNPGVVLQIVRKLLEMRINNFEHVENWLSFVNGE